MNLSLKSSTHSRRLILPASLRHVRGASSDVMTAVWFAEAAIFLRGTEEQDTKPIAVMYQKNVLIALKLSAPFQLDLTTWCNAA